jgi:hypothetical protein
VTLRGPAVRMADSMRIHVVPSPSAVAARELP